MAGTTANGPKACWPWPVVASRPSCWWTGGGSAGGDDSTSTFGQSGGYTWVYFYPILQRAYEFKFNTAGRLLSGMERGRFGGRETASQRGIHLGSSVSEVYSAYGWPDNLEEQGSGIVLNYSQNAHALFAVINGKVVGMSVSLFEVQKLQMIDISGASSGGGSGGGGGGKAAGMPAMSGMGGGKGMIRGAGGGA